MTRRSHPPALLRRTERTLREETPLRRGDRIVVGVSGGGDSSALLHVLSRLASRFAVEIFAHGVDHGLREAARAELDLAERLASELGVPFSRTLVTITPGGNIQSRAREARYAALDAEADRRDASWVATAHHANDRAETVLMHILRGTRAAPLLPAASERRLRPFIRSPASAVAAHVARHGLEHATDPSNRDPRFLRTRIRHELIPLLEELTPGATDHLNLLADDWTEQEPVVVTDAQGRALRLNRSQVDQIRRARKLGLPDARIWLAGGLEITAASRSLDDRADVVPTSLNSSRKPRPGQQKQLGRGAKPTKSD